MMKHSSSYLTNPSIDSYLYWLNLTFWPMLCKSKQIGGSLITIWNKISDTFYTNFRICIFAVASPS